MCGFEILNGTFGYTYTYINVSFFNLQCMNPKVSVVIKKKHYIKQHIKVHHCAALNKISTINIINSSNMINTISNTMINAINTRQSLVMPF